jgi:hypothetical protein
VPAIRRLYRRPPMGGRVLRLDEFGPLDQRARHGHVMRHCATHSHELGVEPFLVYYDLKTDRHG